MNDSYDREERSGNCSVLVTTQVAESLDVSFNALVNDLADSDRYPEGGEDQQIRRVGG